MSILAQSSADHGGRSDLAGLRANRWRCSMSSGPVRYRRFDLFEMTASVGGWLALKLHGAAPPNIRGLAGAETGEGASVVLMSGNSTISQKRSTRPAVRSRSHRRAREGFLRPRNRRRRQVNSVLPRAVMTGRRRAYRSMVAHSMR